MEIRPQKDQPKDDEMRTVIIHATSLLGRSLTPEVSASRLENKLAALWKELGDPNGGKKPYALYQYGAFTRTLPGLEDSWKGFPGMLNEIAEEVRKQQTSQMSVTHSVPEKQRRSQRMTVRDASLDPIICRCGFTQHIACIHCDQCFTWQHAICYYDTEVDEDLPQEHICDDCSGSNTFKATLGEEGSDDSLARKLGRLNVHTSTTLPSLLQRFPQTNHVAAEGGTLGPFGLPRDGEFFWGPAEDDIISTMERLLFGIRQVVYSLLHVGVSVPKVKAILAHREDSGLNSLLEATHGAPFEAKIKGLVSQPVRSGIRIARMFMGLIAAVFVDLVFRPPRMRSKTVDKMLSQLMYRNVLEMNGPQILRDLRRKTLLSLLEKWPHSPFGEMTGEQADALADQVLELLHEMLPSSYDTTAKHLAAEEEIRSWKRTLKQAFAIALQLKTQLALSERLYEIYTPPIGSVASEGLPMVDDYGEEVETGQAVEVCLVPAVVEYESKDLGIDFDQFLLLSAEDIFVTAPSDRRSMGKTVSPAIIVPAT